MLKFLLPTTSGVIISLLVKGYIYYFEQVEAHNAKLSSMINEKHQLGLKLLSAKKALLERASESQAIPSDLYVKVGLGIALGIVLTLAYTYTPPLSVIIQSFLNKIAIMANLKEKALSIKGLDSEGNEVVATLVGNYPGRMEILFGSEHQEVSIGTLLGSAQAAIKQYSNLYDRTTALQAESTQYKDLYDSASQDIVEKLKVIDDLSAQLIILEAEIQRLSKFDTDLISPTDAINYAASLFD